jgi:hypothetical protein
VLSGDQRIIITPASAGVGAGEQRILLTNPSTGITTEQRVLVTPSGGEQRIIMAPAGTGGEPRIILASPSPAGGEPRILVTPGSQGTILQQSASGQTLVYRTLPAAAQQTYSEPQQLSDNSQPQYATLQVRSFIATKI